MRPSCFPHAIFTIFMFCASTAAAQDVTHIEQDDSSITYSGNWWPNASASHSGGDAVLTNTRGARATITFNGTGITWKGVADGWAGLATVYVDGHMQVIDTYAPVSHYQQAILSVRHLAPGAHTLTIEVTHERGPGTNGSWVWIDAFDIENGAGIPGGVEAGGGRIEENNPALLYTGRWFSNASAIHSGGSTALAMDAGSRVTLTFTGTGIAWRGHRDEWSGIARVYIDGEPKGTIDCYLSPAQPQASLFVANGLTQGRHTVTIEATGTKSAPSGGSWVWVDALDVVP